MAVTATHRAIVRDLFKKGLLPQRGGLLEIGEGNWYGPIDPRGLESDIREFVKDDSRRDALLARLEEIKKDSSSSVSFEAVKIFYGVFYDPTETQAIDLHGTRTAHRLDLNLPVKTDRKFAVVINHGTAEHIFNIGQVFTSMHDVTQPGGLMIHESPFLGWIDHGFYNVQPTLFFDLAEQNDYTISGMYIQDFVARTVTQISSRQDVYDLAKAKKIGDNTTLFTALKQSSQQRPFQIPLQGYYRGALPESGMSAWMDLR